MLTRRRLPIDPLGALWGGLRLAPKKVLSHVLAVLARFALPIFVTGAVVARHGNAAVFVEVDLSVHVHPYSG